MAGRIPSSLLAASILALCAQPAWAQFLKEIPVSDPTFSGQFYEIECSNNLISSIGEDGAASPLIALDTGRFVVDLVDQTITFVGVDGKKGTPIKVRFEASRTEGSYSKRLIASWNEKNHLSISINSPANRIVEARSAVASRAPTLGLGRVTQILFGTCTTK